MLYTTTEITLDDTQAIFDYYSNDISNGLISFEVVSEYYVINFLNYSIMKTYFQGQKYFDYDNDIIEGYIIKN